MPSAATLVQASQIIGYGWQTTKAISFSSLR